MKTPEYTVFMAFDKDGKYVSTPGSRCGCPDGLLFCSHMLCFILFVYAVQAFKLFNYQQFLQAMPEPVKSIHSIPIPWSFLFKYGHDKLGITEAAQALYDQMVTTEESVPDEDVVGNAPESNTKYTFPLLEKVNEYMKDCICRGDC